MKNKNSDEDEQNSDSNSDSDDNENEVIEDNGPSVSIVDLFKKTRKEKPQELKPITLKNLASPSDDKTIKVDNKNKKKKIDNNNDNKEKKNEKNENKNENKISIKK